MSQSNNGTVSSKQQIIFVDEEGNQIEPGSENLLYVDVEGNEIPESLAIELLRSGEYIDSRELFQANDMLLRSLSKSIATSTSNASIKSVTQVTPTPTQVVTTNTSSNEIPLLATPPIRIQSRTLTSNSQASIANTLKKTSTESLKLLSNSDSIKKAINAQFEAAERFQQEHQEQQQQSRQQSTLPSKKSSLDPTTTKIQSNTSSVVNIDATSNPFAQKVIELQNLIEEQKQMHDFKLINRKTETPVQVASPVEKKRIEVKQQTPIPIQEIFTAKARETPINSTKNSSNESISSEQSFTRLPPKIPDGYVAQPASQILGYNSSSKSITKENAKETLDYAKINAILSGASKKSSIQSQKSHLEETQAIPKFKDTDLGDYKYDAYLDPFTSDLFKDEIIDIDYGAIDAFNHLLNAQFNQELAEHSTNVKNDKSVFASNLVRSNYGSFIQTQLALGDSLLNLNNEPALTLASFDEYKTYYDKHGASSLIDIRSQSQQAGVNKRALVIEDVPNDLSGQLSLDDLSGALNSVILVNGGPGDNKTKILNELKSIIKTKQFLNGAATTLAH